jgi:hypothetical protein
MNYDTSTSEQNEVASIDLGPHASKANWCLPTTSTLHPCGTWGPRFGDAMDCGVWLRGL